MSRIAPLAAHLIDKKVEPLRRTSQMPQDAWSPKRERQYEHIKGSHKERGANEEKAEEIAARTGNKERARSGEAKEASRTSLEDISSGHRGAIRPHTRANAR